MRSQHARKAAGLSPLMVLRSVACLSLALWGAQSLAQVNLPSLPNTVTGTLNLDMSASAYRDGRSFSDTSSDGRVLSGHLVAMEDTRYEFPPGSLLAVSSQRADASATVSPTSISLYSLSAASARTYPTSPAYSASAFARAQAFARTPFLVQGGGTPGSSGTLVATLLVSGSVSVRDPGFNNPINQSSSSGQASMYFWATGLNASGCSYYTDAGCLDIRRDSTGDTLNSNNAVRAWTLNIPFTFDSVGSFYLQMWTYAEASVTAPRDGGEFGQLSESDFANTLRWGGIQSVLDDQGMPVSGWGISSLPGVDLTVAAVPEPGNWAMMLGGLLALGWLKRSRQAL
jgi:hypothetical protein